MPPSETTATERAAGQPDRVGDGPRHGLPERSTASLRAVLREGMTRPGKDHVGEVSSRIAWSPKTEQLIPIR